MVSGVDLVPVAKPDTPVTLVGYTGFSWAHWYQHDRPRAKAYAQWGLDRGVDFMRWALIYNGGLGTRLPSEPDFWKWSREAADYLTDIGLGQEVSAICDNQEIGVNETAFFDQADDVLGDIPSLILDGGNEFAKNGFNPAKLNRPRKATIASRGSNIIDQFPFRPPWSIGMGHTNRDRGSRAMKMVWDWHAGDTGGQGTLDGPIGIDEMIAFGETEQRGRTTNNPQQAFSYGAGARFFRAALICSLQRESIIDFSIPGPLGTACLDALVRGVRTVPIMPADAPLFHGDRDGNASHPFFHVDRFLFDEKGNPVGENRHGAERTYLKRLPDGRIGVLVNDPGPEWDPTKPGRGALNGYRIEHAYGREGEKPLAFLLVA